MKTLKELKAMASELPKTGGYKSRLPVLIKIRECEKEIDIQVNNHYPELIQWKMTPPGPFKFYKERDGFYAWNNNRQFKRAVLRWANEVLFRAACRISEAYGLGAGDDWLVRIGEKERDKEIIHTTDNVAINSYG